MRKTPFMAPGIPSPVIVTVPLRQKPPSSSLPSTLVVILPPGPAGLGEVVPAQDQLPEKTARFAISAGGCGAASSAQAQQGATTATVTTASTAIDRFLIGLPPWIAADAN